MAIGDIGVVDSMIHIGDEAMFEAFIDELGTRGIHDVTAVSSNPTESSARYSIAAIGHDLAELERVIRSSDAVAITGGGNLASTWPAHIRLRLAIAEFAHEHGKPLAITGQTLGPHFTTEDSVRMRRLLSRAQLVGVRERASFELASTLGVSNERLHLAADDASFLAHTPVAQQRSCVVTLSTHVGGADRELFLTAIAGLLDGVAKLTGLEIVFHAHFASLERDVVRGDTAMHTDVARRMRSTNVNVEQTTDARAAAQLARSAALVITSRYHPAVFAMSGSVPTIAIPVDDYTSAKLAGALGNFGQSGILDAAELMSGLGMDVATAVWSNRESIRERGATQVVQQSHATSAWWDRVALTLSAQR